ncbi:uncharacterized protein VICG_00097 [Vittaforma corneae ATCC 50505]|uniref:Uncharacterized protein n=1 Tax=Vittaforma corneae (strain ATCC 50505) TaxID=993615 RepID=L2GR35_VITCO|nr:uncharacterized protein VICG_00097 [Vittaforma corneae ATCC 50505]ELA42782.1 hypothetical protein VICG_00097 [Vittaforma corneae ATCC 50505]
MEISTLQTGTAPSPEKYKHTKFKGRRVKYNAKLIIYDKEVIRFENTMIVADKLLYIQNQFNSVFVTDDMRNFQFLGMGEIVGLINSSLIVKLDMSYWVYCNGIRISLFFYMRDEKICYSHKKNENCPELYTNCTIYENFLVVMAGNSALFINFRDSNDVQCKFSGPISKCYGLRFRKLKFFVFEYMKHELQHAALFYHSELLSSDVVIKETDSDEPTIMYNIKTSRYEVRSAQMWPEHERDGSNNGKIEFANTQDAIYYKDELTSEPDNFKNQRSGLVCQIENKKTPDFRAKFQISPTEYRAFNLSPIRNKIDFLKSIFSGAKFDIITDVLDRLIHSSKSITSLIVDSGNNAFKNLAEQSKRSSFYEKPDLSVLRQMPKFKFRGAMSSREIQFINRHYHRIFQYNPQITNSKNLAYRIIKMERDYIKDLNVERLFKDIVVYNQSFLKLVNARYEDPRIEEVLQILLENSISLQQDISDVNNFRQSTFLLRCSCNIGPYFANHKSLYYKSVYKSSLKLNSLPLDDKLPKELGFLSSACLFSYFKQPAFQNIYEQLGHAFGQSLASGLSQDSLQQYLKLAQTANDSVLVFIYLVLSTYPVRSDLGKNHGINTMMKSALEGSVLDLKKSSMCALAIYNLESHDRNILYVLKNEIERYGPVKSDRHTLFYTSEYRKLAAICTAMVAKHPLIASFNDSFCELVVTGLSSVNSGINSTVFSRSDDGRPDEIFYSTLFQLTCDFSAAPKSLMNDMNILPCQAQPTQIYKVAARIFYISLYYLNSNVAPEEHVYDKIYDFTLFVEDYVLENQDIQILFNFSLVALSIMKCGTCDIGLCRILRRQILKTKEVKHMKECTLFDFKKKDMVSFKGYDFESMQFYKICLGLVCMNFGMSRLKRNAVKQLIITFFITNACTLDFNFIDVLRMLLVKYLEDDQNEIETFKSTAKKLDLKSRRKKCMKFFETSFSKMTDVDKKFVIDVISDYYENIHFPANTESIFDMKLLAKILSITK